MTIQDPLFKANYYVIEVINFVFLMCDASAAYYFSPDGTCITQCPDSYLSSLSPPYMCESCSTNCSKCSHLFDNCTECYNDTYLDNNTCIPCSGLCETCRSASVCSSCIDTYTFNGSVCLPNCTLLYHCIECDIINNNFFCLDC